MKSRRSRRSPRSLRSNLLRSRRLKLLLSVRASLTRTGLTLTTVSTPSSSIVSPGVTPSPRARRRRRLLWVTPSLTSLESVLSCELSSSSVATSLPVLRLPRPPRRRRRRNSSLSPSLLLTSAVSVTLLVLVAGAALLVLVAGAAWNNGTGIDPAFLLLFLSSPSTAFLAARLRGALGSSAI